MSRFNRVIKSLGLNGPEVFDIEHVEGAYSLGQFGYQVLLHGLTTDNSDVLNEAAMIMGVWADEVAGRPLSPSLEERHQRIADYFAQKALI